MTFCRILILLVVAPLVIAPLAGCAIKPSTESPAANILDTRNNRWITVSALPAHLEKADFVIIGEMYQSLTMRDSLLKTLEQLKTDQWIDTLVLDSLQSRLQSSEADYSAQLDKQSQSVQDRYRPILLWAEQSDVVIAGASLPKANLNSLKKPEGQQWLQQQTKGVLSDKKEQQLRTILDENHPDQNSNEQSNWLVSAHKLNDYFMARTLVTAHPRSVLLTRAFHARKDLGVSPYVQKLKPGAQVTSVLMLGPLGEEPISESFLTSIKPYFDFIWLQAPENNLLLAPLEHAIGNDKNTHKE